MPPADYRFLRFGTPFELFFSFLIGGFLGMVLIGGWPPDIDSAASRTAFWVGGAVVIVALVVSRWRRRGKAPGA
jgi:hypothetical protein